ncbi:MAG: hypothetical protein AAFS12_19490 [Cyanobacteria bacterium J06632_19]
MIFFKEANQKYHELIIKALIHILHLNDKPGLKQITQRAGLCLKFGETPNRITINLFKTGLYWNFDRYSITNSNERIIDERFVRENNVQGDLIIVPANTTHQAASYKEGYSVAIAIDPVVFAQTIYEVVEPDKISR